MPKPPAFGFNDDPHEWDKAGTKKAKRAKSTVARTPLDIDVVASQGFKPYDEVYKTLKKKGVKPVFAIASNKGLPQGRKWKALNRKLAKRYKGATFEVGNEPNHPIGGMQDTNSYVKSLKQAEKAIHSVRPKATVLSAGLAPGGDYLDRIKTIAKKTKNRDIGISAHLYPFGKGGVKNTLKNYKKIDKIAGKKDVWITETGASSGRGLGEVAQAKQNAKLLKKLTKKDAEGVIFHSLTPTMGGGTSSNASWHEGLSSLNEDLTPKASFRALRKARKRSLRRLKRG